MSGSIGDNVFRASGVIAAAAAGRTGTVDWDTTPKVTGDSPVTAATGSGYFLNTTAGTITINLPAGAAGSIVSMADYAATWQTNNVTVAANGSEKIGGIAQDAELSTEGQSVTFVYVDSTQGWINTMDSTSNVRGSPPFVAATGGNQPAPCGTTCGDYKIHKFTGPGTFCVSSAGAAPGSNTVDYMVIAGGGGGGAGCASGGGGGAGGLRKIYPNPATGGFPISVSPYSITVGGGGAGGAAGPPGTPGCKGNDSVFSTVTSTGGGLGGMGVGGNQPGGDGGSGGGGGRGPSVTGGSGNTPAIPAPLGGPQGNDGGAGGDPHGGAAGGGHTSVGAGGAPQAGGDGGAGTTVCISGSPTAYAGGGGGGSYPLASGPSCGGTGGGGKGSLPAGPFAPMNGTDNTGGGGGGSSEGGYSPPIGVGGTGGSGIVIIRYKFQ